MLRTDGRARTAASIIAWLALVSVSVALSVAAAANDSLPGDVAFTTWLQDEPFPGEHLSRAVRKVTSTQVVVVTGLGVVLVAFFRRRRRMAAAVAGGLIIVVALQATIKDVVDRPRPDPTVVERRASFSSPSFPAGHVMGPAYLLGAAALAAGTRRPSPAWLRAGTVVVVIAFLLDGLANVWVGVHWPSDVLGGYLWGMVVAAPAWWAATWRRAV